MEKFSSILPSTIHVFNYLKCNILKNKYNDPSYSFFFKVLDYKLYELTKIVRVYLKSK